MLGRRNISHGSFPICESAYKTWFYTSRPKCDKKVPHKSTTFFYKKGDALRHGPSVASVHFKVLMFVLFQFVHPSCQLTSTLSVRQRSAENTEKKEKKKEQNSVAEKKGKYLELAQERKWTKVFFLVPRACSVRNWSKSMSCHVQVIQEQARCIQFRCLALQHSQTSRPPRIE